MYSLYTWVTVLYDGADGWSWARVSARSTIDGPARAAVPMSVTGPGWSCIPRGMHAAGWIVSNPNLVSWRARATYVRGPRMGARSRRASTVVSFWFWTWSEHNQPRRSGSIISVARAITPDRIPSRLALVRDSSGGAV
jgi:hypothetical protein